jgi:hypothetical protein
MAQSTGPPKFLIGFAYTAELTVTDDGVPFVYYVVVGEDFRPFLKSIRKNRVIGFNIEKNGLLWIDRKVEGWDISVAFGRRVRKALVVFER